MAEVTVEVVETTFPFGEVVERLSTDSRVLELVRESHRVRVFVSTVDDKLGEGQSLFEATVFNPESNLAVAVRGDYSKLDELVVRPLRFRPNPTSDELVEAMELIRRHPDFKGRLEEADVSVYLPMPPLGDSIEEDGSSRRLINLAVRDPHAPKLHQLVAVDLNSGDIDFDVAGRLTWWHGDHDCESTLPVGVHQGPSAGGFSTVRVRVIEGGTELWSMLVTRPRDSQPAALGKGAGIELRDVRYRGKLVLYQAHVPILNVLYDNGTTYRDWQNGETLFEAVGNDPVGPGWRVCSQPPRTILESSNDSGNNFVGVAFWYEDGELRIVSELEAAWYRYVSDWRFNDNGTIKPRLGFAGTRNPATCLRHQHHAYWRLDFDVEGASPNVVEQRGVRGLFGRGWMPVTRERSVRRSIFASRWRVRNTRTNAAYVIIPGGHDGTADSYGVADLWLLRYHGGELDDGISAVSAPQSVTQTHLDKFDNDESLVNTDVVVWYAGHWMHDEQNPLPHQGHIVGPDLIPINW